MNDGHKISDSLVWQAGYNRAVEGGASIFGWGMAHLWDERGNTKQEVPFTNLVTKVGNQYYADRAAGALGSTVSVTGGTGNTISPIVLNVGSGLAPFGAGDKVVVASVGGNTAANGTWDLQTVTATALTLRGTTGNGAYTSGGTVQSFTIAKATGMRLGTSTTAAATTGAGAAIVAYAGAGVNATKGFDSNPSPPPALYPTVGYESTGNTDRRFVQYVTTWVGGDVPSLALNEAVITVDPLVIGSQTGYDVAGTAANTICRAVFSSTVNKGASGDTLALTWTHDLLGA